MTQPNVVVIIEARMTSTRLPGKHIKLANGKPILEHLIKRLKTIDIVDKIVIATTINSTDDVLVEFAKKVGVEFYRGSELDVMGRVVEAAEAFKADVICEVTGDCPIIDPQLVEQLIKTFLLNNVDYVSDGQSGLPGGMTSQVFSLDVLKRSTEMTQEPLDREHVTLHIRYNPELFSQMYLVAPKHLCWPELMLLLDENDDYEFLKLIIEYFGDKNPYFDCLEVIKLLRSNPEWVQINENVMRKGDT